MAQEQLPMTPFLFPETLDIVSMFTEKKPTFDQRHYPQKGTKFSCFVL